MFLTSRKIDKETHLSDEPKEEVEGNEHLLECTPHLFRSDFRLLAILFANKANQHPNNCNQQVGKSVREDSDKSKLRYAGR